MNEDCPFKDLGALAFPALLRNNAAREVTLTGHMRDVCAVEFSSGASSQSLVISSGHGRLVKVWDYERKECLFTVSAFI